MLNFMKQLCIFIILGGIAVAILRIFGWDPFSFIDWATGMVWWAIDGIANWLNSTRFRDFFRG